MLKRILFAIDPDEDSVVASRVAIDLAKRHDAEVSCLAVIDLASIEASARGGGIGSFYYAEKLQEKLTDETRAIARDLIASYEERLSSAGIRHVEFIREGVPVHRIVEDMKVHDLLLMGRDPHFFYAHPKKDTNTVARVVKRTVGPTMVIGSEYRSVKRVLIAYDGSDAAARAVSRLIHLRPFGDDIQIDLVTVYSKDSREADLMLQLVKSYFEAHGFSIHTMAISGTHPKEELLKYARDTQCDVIVAGAHAVSAVKRMAFGSTTAAFLSDCNIPLFLDN